MEVLYQLQAYLEYMKQLGMNGLALEESPFLLKQTAPPAGPRPLKVDMPAGAPSPGRPEGLGKKPEKAPPPKPDAPSLLSIMETVDQLSVTSVDTKAQAAEVTGADATEMLRNLYGKFHNCQACALGTTRNRFVFGEGPPNAPLMFVGEFPTPSDDTTGRPFMDQSGQLLTKIIKAMGMNRNEVFITNVVKCAPPMRMPLPDELDTCAPILARQIEAVNPKVVVALGATALRFFRGEQVSLMRVHGEVFQWRDFKVMATFHPEYILRNPRAKRDVWDDLQKVIPLIQ